MSRDGFLSRWSRLKTEAREQKVREDDLPPPQQQQHQQPAPAADLPPDAAAPPAVDTAATRPADTEPAAPAAAEEPLDLPDIDSLTRESDYTVFLQEKVPAALRKQALRKLWRSDPVFANLDGLNDYDDDYSKPAIVGAAVRTAYDALRGYAPPPEAEAEEGAAEAEVADASDAEGAAEEPSVDDAVQNERADPASAGDEEPDPVTRENEGDRRSGG